PPRDSINLFIPSPLRRSSSSRRRRRPPLHVLLLLLLLCPPSPSPSPSPCLHLLPPNIQGAAGRGWCSRSPSTAQRWPWGSASIPPCSLSPSWPLVASHVAARPGCRIDLCLALPSERSNARAEGTRFRSPSS